MFSLISPFMKIPVTILHFELITISFLISLMMTFVERVSKFQSLMMLYRREWSIGVVPDPFIDFPENVRLDPNVAFVEIQDNDCEGDH